MPRIFISYRRADSSTASGRLYKDLRQNFGKHIIFKDVDDIPLGKDFRQIIREATEGCEVMLVIIGPDWLDARDEKGGRRLDDPDDFVRFEIEIGLRRRDIAVIPVLVEGAKMPTAVMLPASIRELSFRNAYIIHDDPLFDQDSQKLVRLLRPLLHNLNPQRQQLQFAIRAALVLVVFAVIFFAQSNLTTPSVPRLTREPTATDVVATPTTATLAKVTPSDMIDEPRETAAFIQIQASTEVSPAPVVNVPPVTNRNTLSGGGAVNAGASLMLVYTPDHFVLLNQSGSVRNIRGLAFEQRTATTSSAFQAVRWQTDYLSALRGGDCLMLWQNSLSMLPTPDYCGIRRAWMAVGAPNPFWLSSDANATFQVLEWGTVIATCPVNLGDCGVNLD